MITAAEHIDNLLMPVKKIVKALRSVARKNMPGAYEMVYHNALGYSTSESPWDRVCYIAHQPKDAKVLEEKIKNEFYHTTMPGIGKAYTSYVP